VVEIEVWKIVGIVIILVFAYIVGYYLLKETPKKQFKKASNLHREGEECYESGEFDLAEEYYQKANELRRKAQETA